MFMNDQQSLINRIFTTSPRSQPVDDDSEAREQKNLRSSQYQSQTGGLTYEGNTHSLQSM